MSAATMRFAAGAAKAKAALVSAVQTATADTVRGLMLTSHLLVTLAGTIAIVTTALVLANDNARAELTRQWTQLTSKPVPAYVSQEDVVPVEEVMKAKDAKSQARAEQMQVQVTQYLSRRYRVADGAIRPVVAAAFDSGRELELDPLLILAVMAIESSMNPFAESHVGAQGLMQVLTRVHLEKFEPHGGETAALDPIANVKVGSIILKDLVSRGGSVERGLQLYVGAGNMADDGGYGARVLAEHARIKMAAGGNIAAALAVGQRAAAKPEAKPEAQPVSIELAPVESKPASGPSV